jgi:hypothetical protein
MNTELYSDREYGTSIVFEDRPRGESAIVITVAAPPFSKHTVRLDLDEVDRLLAVREHAADPVGDIAEYLLSVHAVFHAERAARAFVACAGSIAETIGA